MKSSASSVKAGWESIPAYDPPPMDLYFAVKTLPRGADPRALSQFYKECAALESLSHPNIVDFDIGDLDDGGVRNPFFVMPLLAGHTLQELIANPDEPLTVDQVSKFSCKSPGRCRPPTRRS